MFKEPDFYGYFAVFMMGAIVVLSVLGALTDAIQSKKRKNGKSVDTDKL